MGRLICHYIIICDVDDVPQLVFFGGDWCGWLKNIAKDPMIIWFPFRERLILLKSILVVGHESLVWLLQTKNNK